MEHASTAAPARSIWFLPLNSPRFFEPCLPDIPDLGAILDGQSRITANLRFENLDAKQLVSFDNILDRARNLHIHAKRQLIQHHLYITQMPGLSMVFVSDRRLAA